MCVYFVCGGGEPDYTVSPAPGVRLIVLDGHVISFACRPPIQGNLEHASHSLCRLSKHLPPRKSRHHSWCEEEEDDEEKEAREERKEHIEGEEESGRSVCV